MLISSQIASWSIVHITRTVQTVERVSPHTDKTKQKNERFTKYQPTGKKIHHVTEE